MTETQAKILIYTIIAVLCVTFFVLSFFTDVIILWAKLSVMKWLGMSVPVEMMQ